MRVGLAIVMDFVTVFIRGIAVLAHIAPILKILVIGIVPVTAPAAVVPVVLPAVLANIVQVMVALALIIVSVTALAAVVLAVLAVVLANIVQVLLALIIVLARVQVAVAPPVLIVIHQALEEEEPEMAV